MDTDSKEECAHEGKLVALYAQTGLRGRLPRAYSNGAYPGLEVIGEKKKTPRGKFMRWGFHVQRAT